MEIFLTSVLTLLAAISATLDAKMNKASAIEDDVLRAAKQGQLMSWMTSCLICSCFCFVLLVLAFVF